MAISIFLFIYDLSSLLIKFIYLVDTVFKWIEKYKKIWFPIEFYFFLTCHLFMKRENQ